MGRECKSVTGVMIYNAELVHQSSRTEPEAEEKPDARPSVLAALEEKADKVEPVRPFKSYLDKDGDAR